MPHLTHRLPTQTSCSACTAGYFSNVSGSETCTSCAAGKVSPDLAENCTFCGAGTYTSTKQDQCVACDAGRISSGIGAVSCNDCLRGTTSTYPFQTCANCSGILRGVGPKLASDDGVPARFRGSNGESERFPPVYTHPPALAPARHSHCTLTRRCAFPDSTPPTHSAGKFATEDASSDCLTCSGAGYSSTGADKCR